MKGRGGEEEKGEGIQHKINKERREGDGGMEGGKEGKREVRGRGGEERDGTSAPLR